MVAIADAVAYGKDRWPLMARATRIGKARRKAPSVGQLVFEWLRQTDGSCFPPGCGRISRCFLPTVLQNAATEDCNDSNRHIKMVLDQIFAGLPRKIFSPSLHKGAKHGAALSAATQPWPRGAGNGEQCSTKQNQGTWEVRDNKSIGLSRERIVSGLRRSASTTCILPCRPRRNNKPEILEAIKVFQVAWFYWT